MLSRAICQAQRLFQSLPLYKKVKKDLKGKEGGKHFKALSSGIAESWFELTSILLSFSKFIVRMPWLLVFIRANFLIFFLPLSSSQA